MGVDEGAEVVFYYKSDATSKPLSLAEQDWVE